MGWREKERKQVYHRLVSSPQRLDLSLYESMET